MKERIIKVEEIKEILKKYNIGKKPLSLVLGWGEITIIRYLDGQVPTKFHSDILLKIKNDYLELSKYLEKNKQMITEVAYRKAKNKILELQQQEDQMNIYNVTKHIIAQTEDITPLALQKILYYIEGFSLALLEQDLFSIKCEAWVHGPVYREIYERFRDYHYHTIEKNEFQEYVLLKNFNEKETELIDEVIRCFSCYSGKILEEMTHETIPWIKARNHGKELKILNQPIETREIKKYFKEICNSYHIFSISDISKYSKAMFQKVVR